MVLGYESPVAAIGAVMPVVSLHPIVVHLADIRFSDVYRPVLVRLCDASVDVVVLGSDVERIAASWYIDGSVVIACPFCIADGIDVATLFLGLDGDTEHMGISRQGLFHLLCEGEEVGVLCYLMAVIAVDTEFVEVRGCESLSVGMDIVVVLYSRVVRERFSIDIDLVIDNLECIAGFSYASFDVVLTSVHGSDKNVSVDACVARDKFCSEAVHLVGCEVIDSVTVGILHAELVSETIRINGLHPAIDGVSCGEVKDDDVSFLWLFPSGESFVRPLGVLNIAFAPSEPFGP